MEATISHRLAFARGFRVCEKTRLWLQLFPPVELPQTFLSLPCSRSSTTSHPVHASHSSP
ncbi:hypothetical protein Mapa_001655 [Marchantia paleacea]|nr:hypothetical protein Mapa_001655 [Marchantia paleacea]